MSQNRGFLTSKDALSYQTIMKVEEKLEIKNICLGEGGYARVFAAWDTSAQQIIAVKVISKAKILTKINSRRNPEKKKDFYLRSLKSEVLIMLSLSHPNILSLFDYHETEESLFFMLQYCNQGSLSELIKKSSRISFNKAKPLFEDLIEACLYLEQNSIVHRDIKPSNILLHNGRAKICDFGFAVKLNPSGTHEEEYIVGTKEYMAPQVKNNQTIDCKSDVWSLGVTFFEMLFGYIPSHEELQNSRNLEFPSKVDIPIQVKVGIKRMLTLDKKYRATIHEVKNIFCE